MMNPELKERWVTALRSGNYTQGSNGLCVDGKYCCLGVLEEISAEELNTEVETRLVWGKGHAVHFNGAWITPSLKNTISFFGSTQIPVVLIDGKANSLMTHNDSGKTFEQIAKAIEEQL